MIQNGYAREYSFITPYAYQQEFRTAEQYVQNSQLGLWQKGFVILSNLLKSLTKVFGYIKIAFMDQKISEREIQKKVQAIKAVYQGYLAKLNELKKEQNEIISKFIKELEQRKIEEIRKALK